MEERGELYLQKISMSRTKVAKLCHTFIKDGAVSLFHSHIITYLRKQILNSCTKITVFTLYYCLLFNVPLLLFTSHENQIILTHSYSRVVLRVLEKAASENKRFSVYVTESQPDAAG